MTDEGFVAVARRFRAMAEPTRLKILCQLQPGERAVQDIAERLGASQPSISRHLATLLAEGFLKRRREGTSIYYSVADPSVFDLCDAVCGGIERDLKNKRSALR